MEVQSRQAPTEFRYWENIDKPAVRRLRKTAKTLFRFDPAPDDACVRDFAASYYDADPEAEAFVREVVEVQGYKRARGMLDQALSGK